MSAPNYAAVHWRKSSRSTGQGGECVEVGEFLGQMLVRDSKNPAGPVLTFSPTAFEAFLTNVRHPNKH